MSGANMVHGGITPSNKQISSRLLNMKFMQRAAAADRNKPTSSPHTPSSEPPLKRRRTADSQYGIESPTTPGTPFSGPSRANSVVFKAEAEANTPVSKARNHFDTSAFETEWVLNVKLPVSTHVAGSGHGQLSAEMDGDEGASEEEDEEDDDIWNTSLPSGRQTFGSFRKKSATLSEGTSTPAAQSKSAKRNAKTKSYGRDMKRRDPSGSQPTSHMKANSDHDSDVSSSGPDRASSPTGSDSESEASANLDSSAQSSNDDHEDHEEGKPSKSLRHKPSIDFLSEEYNKRLDSMDFHSPGFATGLGKERRGLAGGGASGNNSRSNSYGNSYRQPNNKRSSLGNGRPHHQPNTPKSRTHLGGQDFYEKQRDRKRKDKR